MALCDDWHSRPGTVAYTQTLPDRAAVVLDGMVVVKQVGAYIFVKDPWSGDNHLGVYVGTRQIEQWTSVEITGYTRTVFGHRIVSATLVRQYLAPNGVPFILMPKGTDAPMDWPYMRDIPAGMGAMDFPPPPPEGEDQSGPPPTLTQGTIAWAKNQTSSLTLTGKVVTSVFYDYHSDGTYDIAYFYIQEPNEVKVGPVGGIKVVPPQSLTSLAAKDVVTVSGTVSVDTGGECRIVASNVQIAPTPVVLPKPVAMNERATASGQFYLQPALTRDTTLSSPFPAGRGLSAVGLRVRLYGKVTWVSSDCSQLALDDGSGLVSTTTDGTNNVSISGIRVLYGACSTLSQVGDNLAVTGVLGAEASGSYYVPVVRVPGNAVFVSGSGASPYDGKSWATATSDLQTAIDAAAVMNPRGEVWVSCDCTGPNLADGVAVYGGFLGEETQRSQRNWANNVTTISGTVVASALTDQDTRLDGFTITGAGGSGVDCEDSNLTIANNRITQNVGVQGGGIFCLGGAPLIIRNEVFANSVWSDGSNPAYGGGIFCENAAAVIADNYIHDNPTPSYSGAASAGGGIYVAGMSQNGISPATTNNTICDNAASDGGGIYVASGTPTVKNNIVAYNSSGYTYAPESAADFDYNDVFRNGAQDYSPQAPTGGSNISADPSFLDDGLHISAFSACAGAGDNNVVRRGETDIDGEPRIFPSNGRVDIGADESTNCGWRLTLSAAPQSGPVSEAIAITAALHDNDGSSVTRTLGFSILSGSGSVAPTSDTTASVYANVPGSVLVRAYVPDECGGTAEARIWVYFYQTASDDWPMFHHDLALSGCTSTPLSLNLQMKWRRPLASSGLSAASLWSSPVVSDGVVYVGTDTGAFYAFDAADGTQVATAANLGSEIDGTPCVIDGKVYVGTYDGLLHVLNASDLSTAWTKAFPGEIITGGISVYGGAVYFGTSVSADQGRLHAVNIADQSERPGSPAQTPYPVEYATPAIDALFPGGARCYISDASCGVTAADCVTGAKQWSYVFPLSSFYSSTTLCHGYIVGGSTGDFVYRALDTGPAAQLAYPSLFSTTAAVFPTAAALNGKLYFGDDSGRIYCVDAGTFRQAEWVQYVYPFMRSSPLISIPTGLLLVGGSDGKLYGLSIAGGSATILYDAGQDMLTPSINSSPAAATGRVYIVAGGYDRLSFSYERMLYCFGP